MSSLKVEHCAERLRDLLADAKPFVLNATSGSNGGLAILERIDRALGVPKDTKGVDPRRIFD